MTTKNFSIWADFIERDFIKNELKDLIAKGVVNGATSNPAIFKNAFTTSEAYKEDKESCPLKGKELYEFLAIKDIQAACDAFEETHKANGNDGFVSLEVDPALANDTMGTIEEGSSLHKRVNRKNLMVKVPATEAGYEAMKNLLGVGIDVNATLVFSNEQTEKILQAYKDSKSNSKLVISIFISRFDRELDSKLPENLKGKTGILNGAKCYNTIKKSGLENVRTLFASTGVKDDNYIPSYYIDELIGEDIVNTAPIDTIHSFVKNGANEAKLPISEEEIEKFFSDLKDTGVDFEAVANKLLSDGLVQFEEAFKQILDSLQ
ncbi:MAG: transaldolase [Campylobacterales bacterium]|nr:transaldolase [Campylobacterales bacterium]